MKPLATPHKPPVLVETALSEATLPTLPVACSQFEYRGAKVTNYSGVEEYRLKQWLPADLKATEIVFFPDVCPGKSPLPTGTAVKITEPDWHKFAISDCGCGMQLLRSDISLSEFSSSSAKVWSDVGRAIQRNKGKLGDLGGGNHFLDALASYHDDRVYFLIHTGSRLESGLVDEFVGRPSQFEKKFGEVVAWARSNRDEIASCVERHFGRCERVLDLPHNTFQRVSDGSVIIIKGAVAVNPGDLAVLPSTMRGDVALISASANVTASLNSLSHGTGRTMSRADAKAATANFDFSALRKEVMIPEYIGDSSLRTEAPCCYRPLDECLNLLSPLVTEKERLAVIGYIGHL
jgi:hypothetical protein